MHRPASQRHGRHQHHHDAKAFIGAVSSACELRGLRLTPLRLRVLELIAASEKPVKAYDLLDQLREGRGGAAPPTVYRALDFLLEHRFIHKLESVNAFVGCHHPNEAHQVPFLICDVCSGAVEICDERVVGGELAREERERDDDGVRVGRAAREAETRDRGCEPCAPAECAGWSHGLAARGPR